MPVTPPVGDVSLYSPPPAVVWSLPTYISVSDTTTNWPMPVTNVPAIALFGVFVALVGSNGPVEYMRLPLFAGHGTVDTLHAV